MVRPPIDLRTGGSGIKEPISGHIPCNLLGELHMEQQDVRTLVDRHNTGTAVEAKLWESSLCISIQPTNDQSPLPI